MIPMVVRVHPDKVGSTAGYRAFLYVAAAGSWVSTGVWTSLWQSKRLAMKEGKDLAQIHGAAFLGYGNRSMEGRPVRLAQTVKAKQAWTEFLASIERKRLACPPSVVAAK